MGGWDSESTFFEDKWHMLIIRSIWGVNGFVKKNIDVGGCDMESTFFEDKTHGD